MDKRDRGPAVQMDLYDDRPTRKAAVSPYDDGSRGGVDGPLRRIYSQDPTTGDSGGDDDSTQLR